MTSYDLSVMLSIPIKRALLWTEPLAEAMTAWQINTTQRRAMFLAQVAHESGMLIYTRELWGPTPAQRGYEGRIDLGNVVAGDGYAYRGRGLLQITGRANYRAASEALGVNFVEYPMLLEQPHWAAQSAAWFWQSHGLNQLADASQFERITRVINGGLNGQADRTLLLAQIQGHFQENTA
jgi:putative chitinase